MEYIRRPEMTAVIVSHPHAAAFSVGLATSLARDGQLAGFFTGVAFAEQSWSGRLAEKAALRWPIVRNRIIGGMSPGALHALPLVEMGARAAASGLSRVGVPLKRYDALFALHDAAVSRLPWPGETKKVYAYEDGALLTFRRAARAGIDRVWDLPLPHYLTIEELWRVESQRWPGAVDGPPHSEPRWKRERKDEELKLATTVSVASAFTKRSLEDQGVTTPVIVVPYGFPVDSFQVRTARPSGPFTVLAVGTHDLRKGTPYLLEAWKRAAIPDAVLELVGPMRLARSFVDRYAGLFTHRAHVAKANLGARYAAADVLAFPTLGDGFGLVIQEAMCTGTPVITTPCGGGPECIDDGVNGWLVPPRDIDALVERLRYCAQNRDRVFAIGQAARARAETWTWTDTGNALVRALAS
jgi:glycosyltransferase involved in cell wall biosynthesis